MEQKQYKRTSRTVPQDVRKRISASLKGKKKTPEHCQNISKSLRADTGGYWSKIPKGTTEDDNPISNGDIV
jgi:hypothetical protein